MKKPSTLPEQSANQLPGAEPDTSEWDTKPVSAQRIPEPDAIGSSQTDITTDSSPTPPRRAADRDVLIPIPPKQPIQPRIRRRRQREQGYLSALGIAALLSVIIALLALLVLILFLPPAYIDPYIPGRLATRTLEAQIALSTQSSLATREAFFAETQVQAAANAAATGTAIGLQSTQNTLNVESTALAIVQTATGAALSFDATRTAMARSAEGTAAVSTSDAVRLQFTQTSIAQAVRGTEVASTVVALAQQRATRPPDSAEVFALPTAALSRMSVIFEDNFTSRIDPAWRIAGEWRIVDGEVLSGVCGTSLTVGNINWQNVMVDVDVYNPDAQFAVTLGYGETGRLYLNFGLGGSMWWLASGGVSVADNTLNNVYDPSQTNQIRIIAADKLVTVYVDGVLISEQLLSESTHGALGLYTCPSPLGVPRFDNFRVLRLP